MESFIITLFVGTFAAALLTLARAGTRRVQASKPDPAPAAPASPISRDEAPGEPVPIAPSSPPHTNGAATARAELEDPPPVLDPAPVEETEHRQELEAGPKTSAAFGFVVGTGYPRGQVNAALQALDVAASVVGLSPAEVDELVISRWKAEGKRRPVFGPYGTSPKSERKRAAGWLRCRGAPRPGGPRRPSSRRR